MPNVSACPEAAAMQGMPDQQADLFSVVYSSVRTCRTCNSLCSSPMELAPCCSQCDML